MARFRVPERATTIRRQSTLEEILPEGHLARFVWNKLCAMDFAELEASYASIHGGPGRGPYHPRLLVALWVYGMTQGLGTATGIAQACCLRDDFRWIAGGLCPSDQTLLNLFDLGPNGLAPIWEQLLKALHSAGHIDLSVLAEDGTKLRANASPRSFLNAADIDAVIEDLKGKLDQNHSGTNQTAGHADTPAIRGLKARLKRAEQARDELTQRVEKRAAKASQPAASAAAPTVLQLRAIEKAPPLFSRSDFQHDTEQDIMSCPAGSQLTFVGEYPASNGRRYRLYGKRNCDDCKIKSKCTKAKGRRLKIFDDTEQDPPSKSQDDITAAAMPTQSAQRPDQKPGDTTANIAGPFASITEPEAVMMLATSLKRWDPSYNADITVTRHGFIVSQFLTKHPTDFHAFAVALPFVQSHVGHPECWVGDGHYGTRANLLLAEREGVVLYAPPKSASNDNREVEQGPEPIAEPTISKPRFGREHFRKVPEADELLCPANQRLRLIGIYPTSYGLSAYRLYGSVDCAGCQLKTQCTDAKSRRVKVPATSEDITIVSTTDDTTIELDMPALVQALHKRMDEMGERIAKFRSQTVEPVNAHLKQHGLRRFHVHGLSRCAAVLTLASIAHNLMKWKTREATLALRNAA